MEEEVRFYQEDALNAIRQKMDEVSPNWVKKIMRKMKLTRITDITIERMIACLAIHSFNLPITCELLGSVLNIPREKWGRLSSFLHTIGDKGCLIMKRGIRKKYYEWIVSPIFWKYFNEGWEGEESEFR